MAEFYKILKADPLGDPWTPQKPGAKPIQNFWCQVEGEELAVSIGKQVGNTLTLGQHVYGDLVKATSQKGTDYWKFKAQMVPEGVQRPADSPAQAQAQQATGRQIEGVVGDNIPGWAVPLYNMVEYIYKEMKKMSDEPDINDVLTKTSPADEPVEEPVVEGEKVDLDDLFGKEAVPEVPEVPEEV